MSHPKRSKYTDSGFLRPHNYPKSVPSSETEGGGFVKDLSRVWRQFGGGGTPHLGGGGRKFWKGLKQAVPSPRECSFSWDP